MSTRAPKLEILRAEDRHAAELAAFIREVWDPGSTPESVLAGRAKGAAQNVAEPGVAPPTWIALQAGRVLGYVTTIPIRLWDGSVEQPAYWIKGLMVLPEFRSGPIGYHVLKAATQALPVTGGLAVAEPARRLFGALGYTDAGAIDNYIRPLRPAQMLRQLDVAALGLSRLPSWTPAALSLARKTGLSALGGWSGGWGLRLLAAARRGGTSGQRVELLDPARHTEALDDLWSRVSRGLPSAVVRNAAYLVPRYPSGGNELYRWVGAWREGRLSGIAVLRVPRDSQDERLRGIRVATLSDLLYDPDDEGAGLALLGGVEREALALGGDALLASTSAPAAAALLRRQCYVPLGGTVHLLFRNSGTASYGATVREWWLMRGDGGSDDAL